MEDLTVIITPTRESLLKRTGPIKCTEKNCTSVVDSESHLNMHLAKKHGMEHLLKKPISKKQFHCPETDCCYNTKMHFKQLKLLKQHYVKVHAEKSQVCEMCGKGFSAESALKYHEEYCGISFTCNDCYTCYPCYESLQTHCRRKKHVLLPKAAYKPIRKDDGCSSKSDSNLVCNNKTKQYMLLPKTSDTYIVLMASKQGLDKSCQTDVKHKSNNSRTNDEQQICVETQTVGDCVPTTNNDLEKISIETQTKQITLQTKSCNTSEKLDLENYIAVEQKHSSTQTFCNDEDSLMAFDDDTTFFNCNTETQTDLFSDTLLNSCDFYSNMYTQTPSCENMLLDDLEFNDTYTQTALYDAVRSVESQTMLYNNYRKDLLMCRDVANIETQTDLEVQQILEEIV